MDDCILTKNKLNSNGYGRVFSKGKHLLHHRVVYCEHNSLDISSIAGLVVRHKCDNPPCVNPNHLELGTQLDNVKDMFSRGRQAVINRRNEAHPRASFKTDEILAIRVRYKRGCKENGGAAMAREFDVSPSTISAIVTNRNWKISGLT